MDEAKQRKERDKKLKVSFSHRRSPSKTHLEQQIIKYVKNLKAPPTPQEVETAMGVDKNKTHKAIVTLVDRGTLDVTLDWKLRVSSHVWRGRRGGTRKPTQHGK